MVKFNELGVTRDGRRLIIDVSVRNIDSLKDVYIDKIYVINHHNYADGADLDEICSYSESFAPFTEDEEGKKSVTCVVNEDEVPGLADDLLFVAVKTSGTASGEYKGENPVVGVTYHADRVYSEFMDAMKEIALSKDSECEPPRWFIDLHLRLRALEAAIESGDFALACKWWREFFAHIEPGKNKRMCHCNG